MVLTFKIIRDQIQKKVRESRMFNKWQQIHPIKNIITM